MDAVRKRLTPQKHELVDVAFGVVLALLGVFGFRTTFSGGEELLVGVPAVVLGAALGYVLAKLRAPLLVGVAVSAVVFFVLAGPVALRHRAIAGFLPGPEAVSAVASGLVNSWIRLLTTLPPAGEAGDLLTVPYFCGFAGGVLTVVLALRLRRVPLCVVPPTALLVIGVLFGTRRPASLLLQGAVFGALTIAWVSVRHRRAREITTTAMPRQRVALAVGLVMIAGLGGIVVGPRLPGAGANDRFVLRDEVEPPFDPLSEPSALAAYRNYSDEDVREDDVVTVRGLPQDARLRISVMDDYDDLVWRATGSGSVLSGEYLRVGARIPSDGLGDERRVDVEIHKPHGVWVPLAGDVTSLDFEGDDAERLTDEVRVSPETDTAAVPGELEAGDRYSFTAEFAPLPSIEELSKMPLDGRFRRETDAAVPTEFVTQASEWAGAASSPHAELSAIASVLRTDGRFSDGGPEANPKSAPGHSLLRLLQFLDNDNPFGNGEQFGAALGLLAKARGIPVRVVMGFVNEDGGDVVTFTGEDIDAWVEVPVEGVGWVPVSATPTDRIPPEPLVKPRSPQENPEPQPPPPTTTPPANTIPDELDSEPEDEQQDDEDSSGGFAGFLLAVAGIVGVPLLVLGGPAALVLALKARRRKRRRTQGTPSQRVSGSFAELVDYARDTGAPAPATATRNELSVLVGTSAAVSLAGRADGAVFDSGEPSDEQVDAAWEEFLTARSELREDMSRFDRVRAAVNLTSLRGRR